MIFLGRFMLGSHWYLGNETFVYVDDVDKPVVLRRWE